MSTQNESATMADVVFAVVMSAFLIAIAFGAISLAVNVASPVETQTLATTGEGIESVEYRSWSAMGCGDSNCVAVDLSPSIDGGMVYLLQGDGTILDIEPVHYDGAKVLLEGVTFDVYEVVVRHNGEVVAQHRFAIGRDLPWWAWDPMNVDIDGVAS